MNDKPLPPPMGRSNVQKDHRHDQWAEEKRSLTARLTKLEAKIAKLTDAIEVALSELKYGLDEVHHEETGDE